MFAKPAGDRMLVLAGLAAVTVAAGLITLERMQGMDGGPGADLGSLGWFLGVWTTMMAAMMLPSAAPMVLLFDRVSREQRRRGRASVPTWVFVGGYLACWAGVGLLAYLATSLARTAGLGDLPWQNEGHLIAAVAIAAAGIYELTPLKRTCLKHCRSPMHYVLGGWRSGRLGALRMGVEHGGWCVACCWGLMTILFAVGVMSIPWMVIVGGLIAAEKTLRGGQWVTVAVAIGCLALSAFVLLSPDAFAPHAMAMGTAMQPR